MNATSVTPQRQVLAIDDDPEILNIVRLCLESEGFQVHTANSPTAGVDLYRQLHRMIDLVLLDYIMPGMTGEEVFAQLRQVNPGVRVLLLTACDDQVARKMFQQGLRGYIQKPFYLSKLVQQIQETIQAQP